MYHPWPSGCTKHPLQNDLDVVGDLWETRERDASSIAMQYGNRYHMCMKSGIFCSDPDILGGTVVFKGTRVPLKNLIDYLEGGYTLDQFLEDFPSVSREYAILVLEEARVLLTEAVA